MTQWPRWPCSTADDLNRGIDGGAENEEGTGVAGTDVGPAAEHGMAVAGAQGEEGSTMPTWSQSRRTRRGVELFEAEIR